MSIRLIVRRVAKRPLVSAAVMISAFLVVGAGGAVVSALDSLLFQPLPLREPNQLMRVLGTDSRVPEESWGGVSFANVEDLAKTTRSFDGIAAFGPPMTGAVLAGGEARSISYALVGKRFGTILGMPLLLGRHFTPNEHTPGDNNVVVLTYRGWVDSFGSDRAIVGKDIIVNGVPHRVAGVLAATGFEYPSADLLFWKPLAPATSSWRSGRGSDWLQAVGRVREGVSPEQAAAELRTLGATLARDYPDANKTRSYTLRPLHEDIIGRVRPTLLLLAGSVLAVLIVGIGNIAILLVAQAEHRLRELAVRSALGANRRTLARLLIGESVLLTLAGGVPGLLAVPWILRAFLRLYPVPLLRAGEVRFSSIAFVAIVITAILAALPAMRIALRMREGDALRGAQRSVGGDRKLFDSFVAAQIAISLLVLFAAGLMLRSLWNVLRVDLGFDPQNVITFRLAGTENVYNEVLRELRAIHGVAEAATSFDIPTAGRAFSKSVAREGEEYSNERPAVPVQFVSPSFFRALSIPIVRGRGFTEHDDADAPPVVIVNQAFAQQFYRGRRALGQRVTIMDEPAEIVGIAGDVRQGKSPWESAEPAAYFPLAQIDQGIRYVILKTSAPPSAVMPLVTARMRALAPQTPIAEAATMQERLT
ncbi:MAG TPA: ABC transporter permease, partial [Thermoanaerobaculia bacterium]|nr:ABC transporter permease [Thermoanaerobaculia bacterium]